MDEELVGKMWTSFSDIHKFVLCRPLCTIVCISCPSMSSTARLKSLEKLNFGKVRVWETWRASDSGVRLEALELIYSHCADNQFRLIAQLSFEKEKKTTTLI